MELILDDIARLKIIELYVEQETAKGKRHPNIEMSESNSADELEHKLLVADYKSESFVGFKKWLKIKLSHDELLACAPVNHIHNYATSERRLDKLLSLLQANSWVPKDPSRPWIESIDSTGTISEGIALVLRPALPTEGDARFYIEDGSGRATLHARLGCRGDIYSYLGYQPDPASDFIKRLHDGYFAREDIRKRLSSPEDVMGWEPTE